MKQGTTLTGLAATLEAQRTARVDFLADTDRLTLLTPKTDGRFGDGRPEIHFADGIGEHTLTDHAERQLAASLDLPWKTWSRLRTSHADHLDGLVNDLMRREPLKRTVRTFDWSRVPADAVGRPADGTTDGRIVRAFLSDRYRRLDNYDVAEAVLPILQQIPDVQIVSCAVTERKLYIKALAPRVTGEIKVGDEVQAGVVISNSEVGAGALTVQGLVYRLICLNGMIVAKPFRKAHIGRVQDNDDTISVLSDATLALDDKAFFAKVGDVVRASVDETRFQTLVQQMRDATETPKMKDVQGTIERVGKLYDFTEGERQGVLGHLVEGGDLTGFGLLNAVTRFAQDVESYERATEMEEVGGKLLDLVTSAQYATLVG